MKKIFLTSTMCIALATPAMADIAANANSAKCDNGTLDTYQGESTLQAQWDANSITLNWYDDSTENGGQAINVTGTDSATCTYDRGIVLPEDPEKTGYEFAGWKVRRAAAAPSSPNCSAITDETICDNTEGCYYNTWGGYSNGKCLTMIQVTSSSYTSCQEITDQDECNSIFTRSAYIEDNYDMQLCVWDSRYGRCDLSYGGRYSEYYYLPEAQKSWCYSASDPYDCGWSVNDDGIEQCVCAD